VEDIFDGASLRVNAGEDGGFEAGVIQIADMFLIITTPLLPISRERGEDEFLDGW
jgi:hypothetical protein